MIEFRGELPVFAGAERSALAAKGGIAAENPIPAIDSQRRRSIIELAIQVVRSFATESESASGQVGSRIQGRD